MKKTALRMVTLLLTAAMLLSLIPMAVSAKDPTTVKGSGTTRIVLADAYDKITPVGETIYLETTLGEPYFDRVRKGDTLTLRVNVEKAGTYNWGLITGWAAARDTVPSPSLWTVPKPPSWSIRSAARAGARGWTPPPPPWS